MNRDLKDVFKIVAAAAALIAAIAACVFVIIKYKDSIVNFFEDLKENCKLRCPLHREEDDYADDELNVICDMDDMEDVE